MTNSEKDTQFKKLEYLKNNVFYGLTNMNNGFDVDTIYYFLESDFEIILERVEKLGVGVYGIETWLNGNLYDVKGSREFGSDPLDSKWYKKAFLEFKQCSEKNLLYSATYYIPNI